MYCHIFVSLINELFAELCLSDALVIANIKYSMIYVGLTENIK